MRDKKIAKLHVLFYRYWLKLNTMKKLIYLLIALASTNHLYSQFYTYFEETNFESNATSLF